MPMVRSQQVSRFADQQTRICSADALLKVIWDDVLIALIFYQKESQITTDTIRTCQEKTDVGLWTGTKRNG